MSYLDSKTTSLLESSSPVPPAEAHAAQIPLQSFSLPTFPPEAFSSGLQSLILTADIKLDDYTSLLTAPFSIPSLPSTITALTLELFSLGYPPGFLSELGRCLPGLKSLTVYSGLLSGTTSESRKDAISFLEAQTALKELHLLDVFGPKRFFSDLSQVLTDEIRFLEISFTYRHSDTAFLNTLPRGEELAKFVKSGLLGLTMRIAEPEVMEEDEEDLEGTEEGIMAAQQKDGMAVVERVVEMGVGGALKVLDLTMFEVEGKDVTRVVQSCRDLKVLGLSVAMEKGWEEVVEALVNGNESGGEVEILELVGVPGVELVEIIKKEGEPGMSESEVKKLRGKWTQLSSVKVSILRTELEQWVRDGETWTKREYY